MLTRTNRFLAMFLCIVMFISLLPTWALAEQPEMEEEFDIIQAEDTVEEYEETPEEKAVDWNTDEKEPLHEHTYEVFVTEPSCAEYGYTTYICACGDSYVDDYTDPLDHPEVTEIPEIPATETSTGVTAGIRCNICGEILEGCEEIPVLEPITATETETVDEPEMDPFIEESALDLEPIDESATEMQEGLDLPDVPEDNQMSTEPVQANFENNVPETLVIPEQDIIPNEDKDVTEDSFKLAAGEETASQGAMMEADTTAPTVSSIKLSASSVTAPGTITVSLGVADNNSSVKNVTVSFRDPETKAYLSIATTSQGNGKWNGTIDIGEDANAGTYTVEFVSIEYGASNPAIYFGKGSNSYSTSATSLLMLDSSLASTSFAVLFREEIPVVDPLNAPVISNIKNTRDGVVVAWKAITEASGYLLFRKGPSDTDWVEQSRTTELKYTDSSVESGTKYSYSVKATNDSSTSDYSAATSIKYVDPPTISSVTNTKTGITVKWIKATGAKQYQLYRNVKSGGNWGGWNELAVVSGASYVDTDVAAGTQYGYRLRSLDSSGNLLNTGYSSGKSVKHVLPPTISDAVNTKTGIRVKWVKATGAKQYQLYRRVSSGGSWGNWSELAVVSGSSYIDTDVTSGTKYGYRLRSLDSKGNVQNTAYSASKSRTFVAPPTLSSVVNTGTGIKVKWNKTTGAKQYQLYRRVSSGGSWGNWSKLAVVSGTSFVDTKVKSGTKYGYRLQSLDSKGNVQNTAYSASKSRTFVAPPTLSSVVNTRTGIKVKWNKTTGAKQYQLYRRISSGGSWGNWSKLAVVSGTSFVDTKVKSGTKYGYRLQSLDSKGNVQNTAYSAGKSRTFVAPPAISGVTNTKNGIVVEWQNSAGAKQYQVYRKVKSGGSWGSWSELAVVNGTSYVDTAVTGGLQYGYRLRSLDSSGNLLNTGYSASMSIEYVPAVTIQELSNAMTGVYIRWSWVSGASMYRVWRRDSGGDWFVLLDTTETSYTDRNTTSGVWYSYMVRPMDSNRNYLNTYSEAKSISYLAIPYLLSAKSVGGNIHLNWAMSGTATGYRIYRKGPYDYDWTIIANTTGDRFVDRTAVAGVQYSYTIRAYSSTTGSWSAMCPVLYVTA